MNDTTRQADLDALAREHVPLARQVACRLHRRYHWLSGDDTLSYAYLGLMLATRLWDPDRGLSFARFASCKALYLAVDEMRKDGLLSRADCVTATPESTDQWELLDPASENDRRRVEDRELCGVLLRSLKPEQRQLLMMIYAEHMTYKEIATLFQISESAVCLRHKTILETLRRQARARSLAA